MGEVVDEVGVGFLRHMRFWVGVLALRLLDWTIIDSLNGHTECHS